MPVGTNQTIDESILDGYRVLQEVGEPDVVTELIDVFLEDLPKRLDRLAVALAGGRLPEVRAAAHALKSSSGSVGAIGVCGASAQLESLARAGTLDGARQLHSRIMVESSRATSELARLRKP